MKYKKRNLKLSNKHIMNPFKPQYKSEINSILSPLKPYTSFKYNNIIYCLGDILLIKAPSISSHSFYYLGKLLRIIPKNGKELKPDWPSIEIEWYYQKSELTRNKTNQLENSQVYNSLSEDEVFATNHKDIIFIETVVGKAKVLTLEEYDKYSIDENSNENIFFSRATYDPLTTEIEPGIDKWKTYCYCQMPYNPNLKYICCDKCGNWIHEKCIGKNVNDFEKEKVFYCKKCMKHNISAIVVI